MIIVYVALSTDKEIERMALHPGLDCEKMSYRSSPECRERFSFRVVYRNAFVGGAMGPWYISCRTSGAMPRGPYLGSTEDALAWLIAGRR